MGKAIGNISIHFDDEGIKVSLVAGRIRHEATGVDIESALIALARECREGYERAKFAAEIS